MSGIQSRVPAGDYFSRPRLSISALKELRRSPLHYRYRLEHPKTSPAMALGTAAHCATLEPERFGRDYVIWEGGIRRGRVWDEFAARAAADGLDVLTVAERELALGMASAVRGDAVAAKYLASGEPEVTMEWDFGLMPCKGRADWLTTMDGAPVLVGLKTTRDVSHRAFSASAARLGYHLQWAWYFDGYHEITGAEPRMVEIAVESEPPHAVVTYVIPEDVIAQGRAEYTELLSVLDTCTRTGEWPGPAQTEHVLSLPSWVYGTDEDVSDLGLED